MDHRWDSDAYIRIAGAEYNKGKGTLSVHFKDGDCATVMANSLLRPGEQQAAWELLDVVDGYHLDVPARPRNLEIPGYTIRLVTDEEFAAHVARKEAEIARDIGRRLRMLRQARGLSAKEVASRAGLSAQSISRIELGQHDVVYTTLKRILAAMGYALRDLEAPPPRDGSAVALPV